MARAGLVRVTTSTVPLVIQGQRVHIGWWSGRVGRSVGYYTTDIVTISRHAWRLYQASLARRGR